jgi:hypothetical protein
LLSPALLFVYLGRGCFATLRKRSGQAMHYLNK